MSHAGILNHLNVLILRLNQQRNSRSTMMVLQWRLIIVQDGVWVRCLRQEVVVQASMLVVMRDGRPVRRHVLTFAQCIALQNSPMTQQHVRHL